MLCATQEFVPGDRVTRVAASALEIYGEQAYVYFDTEFEYLAQYESRSFCSRAIIPAPDLEGLCPRDEVGEVIGYPRVGIARVLARFSSGTFLLDQPCLRKHTPIFGPHVAHAVLGAQPGAPRITAVNDALASWRGDWGETRFRADSELGRCQGGFVMRVNDGRLGLVALKVMRMTSDADQRHLKREALTMQRSKHPNVCVCHDYHTWEDGSLGCLLLEYIDGLTLEQRLEASMLREVDVLEMTTQILCALDTVHAMGIIHRDVKPANIMCSTSSDAPVWKLLDFGVAVAESNAAVAMSATMHTNAQTLGTLVGTLLFMSPEQIDGRMVGRQTDLWSLAVTAYFCLAGRQFPFVGRRLTEAANAILTEEPRPLQTDEAAPHVATVVFKALEKDPAARYGTAAEMSADVQRWRRLLPRFWNGTRHVVFMRHVREYLGKLQASQNTDERVLFQQTVQELDKAVMRPGGPVEHWNDVIYEHQPPGTPWPTRRRMTVSHSDAETLGKPVQYYFDARLGSRAIDADGTAENPFGSRAAILNHWSMQENCVTPTPRVQFRVYNVNGAVWGDMPAKEQRKFEREVKQARERHTPSTPKTDAPRYGPDKTFADWSARGATAFGLVKLIRDCESHVAAGHFPNTEAMGVYFRELFPTLGPDLWQWVEQNALLRPHFTDFYV